MGSPRGGGGFARPLICAIDMLFYGIYQIVYIPIYIHICIRVYIYTWMTGNDKLDLGECFYMWGYSVTRFWTTFSEVYNI